MKVLEGLHIANHEDTEEFPSFANNLKSLEGRLLFAVPKSELRYNSGRTLCSRRIADKTARGKIITGSTQSP